MTNVFVGFQNNQKNCRRSLKPPGGGTSDFFNFGAITDDQKKTDIKTQVQDKKEETSHIVEVEVDSREKGSEVGNEEARTDDQICENFNDMTVGEICEIDDNEGASNEESAADKSANSTTIQSSISMKQTVTRSEVTSEKKLSNRVPPGGHSKGLW